MQISDNLSADTNKAVPELKNPQSIYRPDLDGLRAVAVLAVVGGHTVPSFFPSGFTGVDFFFVISGFLITGIIYDNLESGRFSFSDFYGRRIKRIFPALILILSFCLIIGQQYLFKVEFDRLAFHVKGACGFFSNFLLFSEAGYFDNSSLSKPLLHLWSLAVEEQFYIFWPFCLWFFWRLRWNAFLLMGLLFLSSLCLNLFWVSRDPSATFFLPPTRFWELMTGSLLAWWKRRPILQFNISFLQGKESLSHILSVLGGVLLLYSIFGMGQRENFPGPWAIFPVTGTIFLISAGPQALINRQILSKRLFVGIGLISYPLYLWHWPLLSFAEILGYRSYSVKALIISASILFAWLTYQYVEKPIRFSQYWPRTKVLGLLIIMSSLGILGILGQSGKIRVAFDSELTGLQQDTLWTYPTGSRFRTVSFNDSDFEGASALRKNLVQHYNSLYFRQLPSASSVKVLYIGDSQMEQYWSRIDSLIDAYPNRTRTAVFFTASAFLPIPGLVHNTKQNPQFEGLAETMLAYALFETAIDTVVIAAAWPLHMLEGEKLPSDDSEAPTAVWVNGKLQKLRGGRIANDVALKNLSQMILRLRSAGKRVFLLQYIPNASHDSPLSFVKRGWSGFSFKVPEDSLDNFMNANHSFREKFNRLSLETGVILLDPIPVLFRNRRLEYLDDQHRATYMNSGHLADEWVRKYASFLDETLLLTE